MEKSQVAIQPDRQRVGVSGPMSISRLPKRLGLFAVSLIFLCLLVITLGPVLWMFMSSLKSTAELLLDPWGLPQHLALDNYQQAWVNGGIGNGFLNSIIVSIFSLILMVGSGSMVGFAISRYQKVKIRFPILIYFLLGQMIPGQVVIIPVYILISRLGILNTYPALVLVYSASGLPFVILIMQGFFQSIPRDLYEAAAIDGYGEMGLFLRIALPLAKPALASTIIIQFLFVWNEFILASVLDSSGSAVTLPVGLYRAVIDQYSTNYGVAFAGISIAVIPIIVLYALLQKYILKGITAGALKG